MDYLSLTELIDWVYSVMPVPQTTTERMPFDHGNWVYQPKVDGKRCIAVITPSSTVFLSKHRKIFKTSTHPEPVREVGFGPMVCDCELLGNKAYIFDVMATDGQPLDHLTWEERYKYALEVEDWDLGGLSLAPLPSITGKVDGGDLAWLRTAALPYDEAVPHIEGIVARRFDANLVGMGRPTVFKQKP